MDRRDTVRRSCRYDTRVIARHEATLLFAQQKSARCGFNSARASVVLSVLISPYFLCFAKESKQRKATQKPLPAARVPKSSNRQSGAQTNSLRSNRFALFIRLTTACLGNVTCVEVNGKTKAQTKTKKEQKIHQD